MKISEIKKEMLNHKDFFGGDIMWTDEIENATTKKELSDIMNRYDGHLEAMLADALSHHNHFREKLGLNMIY